QGIGSSPRQRGDPARPSPNDSPLLRAHPSAEYRHVGEEGNRRSEEETLRRVSHAPTHVPGSGRVTRDLQLFLKLQWSLSATANAGTYTTATTAHYPHGLSVPAGPKKPAPRPIPPEKPAFFFLLAAVFGARFRCAKALCPGTF